MLRLAAHILTLGIIYSNLVPSATDNVDKLCQSGLREDNTNYIYCARQNLTTIPSFLNQANASSVVLSGGSNIFYDELVLSDNLIGAIELNSFASMLKVRKLYLDLNPVRFIHELAFQHVRNYLEELYFDFKVTEDKVAADDSLIFANSVFQKCFNLHLLSIKSYQLDKLKPLQFLRMSKLETLILSNNKITHLHENAFKGLEKALTHLNLDSNYLEWIPTASIQGLRNLMRLSLSQNRIKSLHANAFLNLKHVSYLDLSYNYLSKLDSHGFNGPIQTSLQTILLQNNELKWSHLIHLLFNLHTLQELNLDFNKLSGNAIQFDRLRAPGLNSADPVVQLKLQILSLQGNRLDEKSLSALRSSFDYDLFNYADSNSELSSFEFIDSNRDTRQILGKTRQRFSFGSLLQLNLARNKIKNLPNNFFQQANMSLLNSLVLDKNPLESARITQKYFNGLEKSLTSLSLNGVGFNLWSPSSIEALLSLERLQTLKLNGNNQRVENLNVNTLKLDNLKAKSQKQPQLPNLTSLELQNNNLKQLPTFVCQLNALNDLDLSSNQLTELNLNCFKSATSPKLRLKKLNLNNNPLNCDCDLLELKNWLMQTYDKDLLDLIMWQCARPFQLAGRYLVNVQQEELTCPNRGTFTETLKTTRTLPYIQILSSVNMNMVNMTTKSEIQTSTTTTTTAANARSESTAPHFLNKFKTEKILTAKNMDLSYYSLVIGISLGISAICLIILLIFYINCIRRMDMSSNELKNTNPIQFLNTANKYEAKFKFCSPTSSSSSSSSSATNSTTTTVMSSRKNTDDSLSHNSCLSLPGEHSFKTTKKHILFNNFGHQQGSQNNVCRCNCNDLNMLQLNENKNPIAFIQNKQTVFSINEPFMQILGDGKSADTHIYHEINSPNKNCCNNKPNENHFYHDHHYTETQYVFPKNDSLTFILNNINNGRNNNNNFNNKANMQRLLNYNNKNNDEPGLGSSNQYLINDLGSGLIV